MFVINVCVINQPAIIQVAEAKEQVTVFNIFFMYGQVRFFCHACMLDVL